MRLLNFYFFLLFVIGYCPVYGASYSIGLDPTWYSVEVFGKENDLTAFLTSLTNEISNLESTEIDITYVDSLSLTSGLALNRYQGIFSDQPTSIKNKLSYDFSPPILLLGPVLVLRAGSKERSLASFSAGKRVGVYAFDQSIFIAQRFSKLFIQTYDEIPRALNDLVENKIDGLLIPALAARTLVPTLYANVLMIASKPLNNDGIRLITLKGRGGKLQKTFAHGLRLLRQQNTLSYLIEKYQVN